MRHISCAVPKTPMLLVAARWQHDVASQQIGTVDYTARQPGNCMLFLPQLREIATAFRAVS